MPALRRAAGLESGPPADINDNNGESFNQAQSPSAGKGESTTMAMEKTGGADSVDPAATELTASVTEPSSSGTAKVLSSVATRVIPPKFDAGSKLRVSKAAAVVSSVAGRERRGEARRRAEIYEVRCVMNRDSLVTILLRHCVRIGGEAGLATRSTLMRVRQSETPREVCKHHHCEHRVGTITHNRPGFSFAWVFPVVRGTLQCRATSHADTVTMQVAMAMD